MPLVCNENFYVYYGVYMCNPMPTQATGGAKYERDLVGAGGCAGAHHHGLGKCLLGR